MIAAFIIMSTEPASFSPACLALESGLVFHCQSFGADTECTGELVFNTSMTGYQEILTDPSYKGQIVLMTEPHIGNVGVNPEDEESKQVFASGLVIREISPCISNWRAKQTLPDYLKSKNIPGITGLDTRQITRHIREKGFYASHPLYKRFKPRKLTKKTKRIPPNARTRLGPIRHPIGSL